MSANEMPPTLVVLNRQIPGEVQGPADGLREMVTETL